MFIEPVKNLETTVRDIWKPRTEPDDLEAVVHTRHKQVVLAVLSRVPFYTPDTTPDVSFLEGSKGFTCVEEANVFVIAERESVRGSSLRRGMVSHLPTAIRCSICGWAWIVVIPDSKLLG